MNDENPYRSPQARMTRESAESRTDAVDVDVEVIGDADPWPWRWEDYVILPSECALPSLCVECGAPSDRPLRPEQVYWFNPLHFILGPAFLIFGKKQGVVFYTLCEVHDRRSNLRAWLGWATFVGAITQFLLGLILVSALRSVWPVLLVVSAFFTLLLAIALLTLWHGVLRVQRIEKGVVWLKLPSAFYRHLQELPSADGSKPIIPRFELTDG